MPVADLSVYNKMTNYRRIQEMSIEELAEFLDRVADDNRDDHIGLGCSRCSYAGTHHAPRDCQKEKCKMLNGIEGWLRSEVKDEDL